MAILPIVEIPNPVLRKKASPVAHFDAALKKLVDEMAATMYDAPGIGLAAPQVGVSQRVFVMDTSENKSNFIAFVNPEIIKRSGKELSDEGCLSIPGFRESIMRSTRVTVRASGIDGTPFEREFTELDAFCVQHELDHLDGILFTDHLSRLKKPLFVAWLREHGISNV